MKRFGFRHLKNDNFKTFRAACKFNKKVRGGVALIIVPKHSNPKLIADLARTNDHVFESIWIEGNVNNNISNKKRQLRNENYILNKALLNTFRRIVNKLRLGPN